MRRLTSFLLPLCIIFSVYVLGCHKIAPGPGPHPIETQARAYYEKGGWIPLAEPDSRFVPGSIFVVQPGKNPEWRSSLESCGVPPELLAPIADRGQTFSYTGDSTYGANAVLKIRGVNPGADFKRVAHVTFQQTDAGPSTFDIIKVLDWMSSETGKANFKSVCKDYLSQPNTYVAQDSYRVAKGTYTLKDSRDNKINLTGPQRKVLDISAGANASITDDSSLALTVPAYTAVHEAIYANDLLKEISLPTRGRLKTADAQILSKLPQ